MRVLLITCIAAFVSATIASNNDESDESFEKHLKEANHLLNNEPNADDTMEFLRKLHSMKDELLSEYSTPQPSAEQMEAMDKYGESLDSNLRPGGSIEEVNMESKVAPGLFQGDMLLTKEQADELLEDVKENAAHHNN